MTDEELEQLRLLNKGEVEEMIRVNGVKIPISAMTESTAAIDTNIFYIWGEMTSLTITLNTPVDTSMYNEYMIQFVSGDTATTLSLPEGITWYLGNNTILSNKTYQISIVNNLAVLGEF